MGRLFGTDGIRGVANVDLTPTLAYDLGRAVGHLLGSDGRRVVIGQDTRRSGDMLVAAVSAGLASVGADAIQLGVVTTPCLAHAAAGGEFAAGIMVSASHNPAEDNGLKVLSGGRKIDDEVEEELESLLFQAESLPGVSNRQLGRITRETAPIEAYRAMLVAEAGDLLRGRRIAIDCANGSASALAPDLLDELGASVTALSASTDGSNINLNSGSTHPEALAAAVRDGGLEMGMAFDGDADRLIAVDEHGSIVDGDGVMGICALARLTAGTLRKRILVTTVMSNLGLDRAISAAGGRVIRTPVGDRHVFEAMERADATLGGEQSGHIIFREVSTTGDGILTAIQLLRTLRDTGATLAEAASQIRMLPQVVINSAVRHRDQWEVDPEFAVAVAEADARLGARGRILVRPSGTEPKIRIMVEGEDADEINQIARELSELASARLN
ncbi:MAG TPA: phosphoglucosamine mutase [Candidatus Limnocylindria bacterium]